MNVLVMWRLQERICRLITTRMILANFTCRQITTLDRSYLAEFVTERCHYIYLVCGGTIPPQEGGRLEVTEITFPLEPKPKLRPRFHIYRGRILTQTPLETKVFENYLADWYPYHNGIKYEKGVPLEVKIIFGMPIPKSFSKKRRQQAIAGEIQHTVKPDVDNLTKSVLDALNEIAWHDDSQIIRIDAFKRYAEEPHISLTIIPKDGKENG